MADRLISAQLMIEGERQPGALVLMLTGELDLASASLLQAELEHAAAVGEQHVVIDLAHVEFMDSAGLHVLLDARLSALETGHQLSLRRGPRAVQRMFDLTHTATMFVFCD